MKKTLLMGLMGLLLGAAAAVGSATLGSEETAARPCCTDCGESPACTECGGDPACEAACKSCWGICNFGC